MLIPESHRFQVILNFLKDKFPSADLSWEKKNWEKPNESRNHFFLCVSKQQPGMARTAEMMLSAAFIRLVQKHCSPGSRKEGSPVTACCAASVCPISSWSRFTEKGWSEGPVIALCSCSGCLHSNTVLLKNFICPNCSPTQPRQEVAHGPLKAKKLHLRVWPTAIGQPLSHLCYPHWIQAKKNLLFLQPSSDSKETYCLDIYRSICMNNYKIIICDLESEQIPEVFHLFSHCFLCSPANFWLLHKFLGSL